MRHYEPSYFHINQLLMGHSGPIWKAAAVFLFLLCHHLTCEDIVKSCYTFFCFFMPAKWDLRGPFYSLLPIAMSLHPAWLLILEKNMSGHSLCVFCHWTPCGALQKLGWAYMHKHWQSFHPESLRTQLSFQKKKKVR